jgi:hypothetical protein
MDDSEKTYGYSEDIYHGNRHGKDEEKSYEYGPEAAVTGEGEGSELSPEEEAIHIEGRRDEEAVPSAEAGEWGFLRRGGGGPPGSAAVESFTWDLEPEEAKVSGGAAEESSKPRKR